MPTALELTPAERQAYIEAIRRRASSGKKTLSPAEAAEREQLLEQVKQVAAEIKARFGARRVILFGSLAHQAWFRPDSDIDIAIEGLEGAVYWQAWRYAEEMLTNRSVDLLDIGTASPSLKRSVQRYGIEL
jgi:predicted nucleotidyltransferase